MDTPNTDAPGEKPDAEVAPEVGVKPPAADDALSQFDGLPEEDIYAMLEAAEKAEIDGPDDDTPEEPEAPKAEAPEPEQQQTPKEEAKAEEAKQDEPKGEDGEPNAPSRIRLKGLTPEARIETAAAVNLINEGKAADLAEALAILRKDDTPTTQPEPEAREEENPAQAREEETEERPALTRATEIKSRIDQLREERDEADEAFDRAEVRRITREIEDLSLDLIRAERIEQEQQVQARSWEEAHDAACERVEQKYPDTGDENSVFSRLLDDKVAGARARRDPALSDPAFIERFADEVAGILGTTRQAPNGNQQTTPKAAPVANGRDVAPGHQSAGRISSAEAARQFDRMSDEDAYAVLEKAESLSRGF